MSYTATTTVTFNTDEVGSLMYIVKNRIFELREDLSTTKYEYSEDLKKDLRRSLGNAISIYLKISEKDYLDF